ncbi:ArsR/SmtB family transcription factor [Halolamina salifodinae]|uniref:ArsR family transcriptional regulator n=1 Tax=Halolamina salifodinae TaxID=1202767 RepID=A0A8T4GVS8_9EURY|nr:ArsR family transcriptional regulator [Halolamina salifodinae]MBP1985794.1 ArsR family transcriptional regulator [Halolamina salifodinae]
MDSAVLLNLLGNENRRRILRLLSHKSCYVTEISEYLGVSPKAVIDHLRKLEEAGLVESHTDDQRRKYFHIARSVRLEVSVSPHSFGAKSAYPASRSLDMTGRCSHLNIDIADQPGDGEGLEGLAEEFDRLQSLERELSLAQRWVDGRLNEVLDRLNGHIGAEADSRFYAAVLSAVVTTDGTLREIADDVDADAATVEDALEQLTDRGLLSRRDDAGWELA